MKPVFLFASIAVASGLLLTNVYTSIVDARSWGSNLPGSIETARQYYRSSNPGDFFRIFSPANQLLGLLVLILFWKAGPAIRSFLAIAFVLYVLGDVLTFAYFYPRNELLFKTISLSDTAMLKKVWSEWSSMNWLRSLILLVGIVFFMYRYAPYIFKAGFANRKSEQKCSKNGHRKLSRFGKEVRNQADAKMVVFWHSIVWRTAQPVSRIKTADHDTHLH